MKTLAKPKRKIFAAPQTKPVVVQQKAAPVKAKKKDEDDEEGS